ncbi:type I polyketide synthase [Streptomyces olivaceoviridis]|uniref:type I polyketide synthase n=1 Tax=Streptomyces olivaceoviridis TaxID=1921 RepID=UPI0036F4CFA3
MKDRWWASRRSAVLGDLFLSDADSHRNQGRAVPHGPVAVVGLSCRLPQAVGPREFWDLLTGGRSGITGLPGGRGEAAEEQKRFGTDTGISRGGFLDQVDGFDAAFFDISPREAAAMDPQQRLALELGWEAIEDAGVVPAALKGERVGVFVGAARDDYALLALGADGAAVGPHTATGAQRGIIANRLSYFLGLRGPSITVDCGQSSSLVAVHLAAQSIRAGECGAALVGGVNLNLSTGPAVAMSRLGALSPDGLCYTFDERANGFVRGEGGGFVLLKPLERAIEDGDRIYCLIRGSAVNNDGGGAALTVPERRAQEEVLRAAHHQAGTDPADVCYVELHGTGTRTGDPIEASALAAVFGPARSADNPLLVGSAKTNVGHLEAAAGIVGLIKTALAIRHGELPPSLNFRRPNPLIRFEEWRLRVVTERLPWPKEPGGVLAGVSSFGMGGTNCHIVVGSPPQSDRPGPTLSAVGHPVPWLLSARTDDALRDQAAALASHLGTVPDADVRETAAALVTRRSLFERRLAVLAADRAQLRSELTAYAAGKPAPRVLSGGTEPGGTAILFSGNGTQRLGMGRGLHACFPAFAEAWDEVCAAVGPELGTALESVVWGSDTETAQRGEFAHAALFALQVASYRLVESLGVRPDFVAGHSVGEITAAHVSGVLSLADAARLIVVRGRLVQALPSSGLMVSVRAPLDAVEPLLEGHEHAVSIAAVNGPSSVVISGDGDAVEEVSGRLEALGHPTRRLHLGFPAHSPLIEPILPRLGRAVRAMAYHSPRIPIVSSVTGRLVTDDLADPDYWVRHARQPVRFADALRTLAGDGVTKYLELGPDTVLSAMTRDVLTDQPVSASVSLLRAGRDEPSTAVEALSRLHISGVPVRWSAVLPAPRTPVDLPTYRFQRTRHWLEPASARASELGHLLLDRAVELPDSDGLLLLGRISPAAQPWLGDHVVQDLPVFPDIGFTELALRAAQEAGCRSLDELTVHTPLVLSATTATQVRVTLHGPDHDGVRKVAVHARRDGAGRGGWIRHATGAAGPTGERTTPANLSGPWPPANAVRLDVAAYYEQAARSRIACGPAFQALRSVWLSGREVFAEIELPASAHAGAGTSGLHPALLDGVVQACRFVVSDGPEAPRLPHTFTGVVPHTASAGRLRVRVTPHGQDTFTVAVSDPSGRPVLSVDSLALRPLGPEVLASAAGARDAVLPPARWTPPRSTPPDTPRVADGDGDGRTQWLVGLSRPEQAVRLLELVRGQVAMVLGHTRSGDVAPHRTFKDQGLNSVTAVELCDALDATTGLRLPATTVFAYPTPQALADHLLEQITEEGDDVDPVTAALDAVEHLVSAASDPEVLTAARKRLAALVGKVDSLTTGTGEVVKSFSSISNDEIFAFIDDLDA